MMVDWLLPINDDWFAERLLTLAQKCMQSATTCQRCSFISLFSSVFMNSTFVSAPVMMYAGNGSFYSFVNLTDCIHHTYNVHRMSSAVCEQKCCWEVSE